MSRSQEQTKVSGETPVFDGTSDLAALRRIAEAGADAPLVHGGTMLLWGLLLTGAYIGQSLALEGIILSPQSLGWMWLGVVLVGWAGQALLFAKRQPAGSGSFGNQVFGQTWRFAGLGFAGISFSLMLAGLMGFADYSAFTMFVVMSFAIYAILFWTAATASRQPWIRPIAIAALLAAIGLVWAIKTPFFYWLAAATSLCLVALPGLLIELRRITRAAALRG